MRALRERVFYGDLAEDRALVAQTYVSLETQWRRICARSDFDSQPPALIELVERLFEQPQSWLTANALEQAIVSLMSPADLDVFFQLKLLDARVVLPARYSTFFEAAWREANGSERTALTFRMLKELHWFYAVRQQRRLEEAKIRVRTGLLFMFSFLFFFFPKLMPATSEALFRTGSDLKSLYAVTAIAAGWIGATFSMMLNMNQRVKHMSLDPLKVMSRYGFLLTRVMIGIGGGLMVFYGLQAGVVGGTFLPDLTNIAGELSAADHAMLVIWCFLAGFSERFVPGLLARVSPDTKPDGPPVASSASPSDAPAVSSAPPAAPVLQPAKQGAHASD
jgi:hypothetical protein